MIKFRRDPAKILNFRRKLEPNLTDPQYIRTVRGFGYIFLPLEDDI